MEKETIIFSLIVVIVLFIVITIFSSFTIVGTGYVGVKTRFGKVQNDVIQEGLNLKVPYIEKWNGQLPTTTLNDNMLNLFNTK